MKQTEKQKTKTIKTTISKNDQHNNEKKTVKMTIVNVNDSIQLFIHNVHRAVVRAENKRELFAFSHTSRTFFIPSYFLVHKFTPVIFPRLAKMQRYWFPPVITDESLRESCHTGFPDHDCTNASYCRKYLVLQIIRFWCIQEFWVVQLLEIQLSEALFAVQCPFLLVWGWHKQQKIFKTYCLNMRSVDH